MVVVMLRVVCDVIGSKDNYFLTLRYTQMEMDFPFSPISLC
jgi:hypothetical protein